MTLDRQSPEIDNHPTPGKRFANLAERQLLNVAEMSVTDSMTGLPNRRAFDISLKQLQQHPGPVAILFLDLDGLKPINDKYGHPAGDKLLKSMANINFPLPLNHKLYRIGGDEFAFIVPWVENPNLPTKDSETVLIEQVKNTISEHNQNISATEHPLSVSIGGFVSTDSGHHDLWTACEKADAKMYQDKKQKQNIS